MRAASIRLIRSTAHARYSLHLTVRRERCPPKTAPSPGGSCPHLTRGYLPPPFLPSLQPKHHLDWFSRFAGLTVLTHTERETNNETAVTTAIWNDSVPIQLAQSWFRGLATCNAKIQTYFSSDIHGGDFIEQHSETVTV